jgi:hypothetical protein
MLGRDRATPIASRNSVILNWASMVAPIFGGVGIAGDFPMLEKKRDNPGGLAEAPPHYHGHRERLRERFREAGAEALSDYELLEAVLFRAMPRRDVKPLAKTLIATFGSFAEVISAPVARLADVKGLGQASITEIKIVQAAASRLLRGEVRKRPALSSWSAVLDYCRSAQAFAEKSNFASFFSTSAISSSPTRCSRAARSTTRQCIHARWSNGRWSFRRPPSSWCTIIHPATRRPRKPTSR